MSDALDAPAPDAPGALYRPSELNPASWQRAERRLLAKALAEFAYEEILRPVPRHTGPAGPPSVPSIGERHEYVVQLDAPGSELAFRARRGAYDGWQVDPETITLTEAGAAPRPFGEVTGFFVRARATLGLDGATLGHLLRELSVTLAADVRLDETALSAAELADLDHAALEGHQTGHPWLVLNKGRLGLSATDAARWAPEARRPAALPWLAVHRRLAAYRGVAGLEHAEDLYAAELPPAVRRSFDERLRARGREPGEYLLLPVHPWQWDEVVLPLFAPWIATDEIVPLGTDGDRRLPQQSVRTFLNTDRPARLTVKLPLSVLNTLVWRGLPTERTLAAPAVTAWMQRLRDADPYLSGECRVLLLGEVASVTVAHPVYDSLDGTGGTPVPDRADGTDGPDGVEGGPGRQAVPYQYRELLGAIWREPLVGRLDPGERPRTLAALLHTDPHGRALTAELVARSGLPARTWLRHLCAALLPPLLHFLYRYGTVFSPHGENAIVVFDARDVPVRLAVKDFVDDVNVSAEPVPEQADMPDEVRRVLLTEPPAFLTQFIHSGLFTGVLRYLAPLCEAQLGVPETEFWRLVRAEILRYQERFPELKERYETFDLLTERIERLCLNRNRLHLDGYRDRPHRPHAAVHGTVPNPLHLS